MGVTAPAEARPVTAADLRFALSQLYSAHQYRELKALCGQILDRDPRHADALYMTGLLSAVDGDFETGRALVEQACQWEPGFRAHDHMIALLKRKGQSSWLAVHERLFQDFAKVSRTDGFVISYPKCGRTWLRLMLGRCLQGEGHDDYLDSFAITSRDPTIPTIDFSHDDFPHWKPVEAINKGKKIYAGKTVLFLVRDPRDVLVSYYFEYTKRGSKDEANDSNFNGTLSDFVRHSIGGLASLVCFYNIWAQNRETPARFQLVTYEDMRAKPESILEECLSFLGLQISSQRIVDAVAYGDFENMRKLEQTDALKDFRLRSGDKNDPESFKVRRGKVSGYMDYLNADDLAYIDRYLDHELDDLFGVYKARPSI